jgi:hypothetical protein
VSRRKVAAGVSVTICALIAIAIFVAREASAPRYQGATVREWCDKFRSRDGTPSDDVVNGFGTNALPDLLSYFSVSSRFYQLRALSRMGSQHNEGGQAAYEWIQVLHQKDPAIVDHLLASDAQAAPLMLYLLSVSRPNVKQSVENSTNSPICIIQSNAKKALLIK